MKLATFAGIVFLLMPNFAATAGEPFELPLWSGAAPGPHSSMQESIQDRPIDDGTQVERDRHVRGVTLPSLTVYLPDHPRSDTTAIVVLPGGGFNILAIDKEGHDVARWLNKQGVAAIVVKYRLPDPKVDLFVRNGSLPDVRRAIRVTRSNAADWRIDSGRIGVVGFSAGGYLTAAIGTMFDQGDPNADDPVERESCRPNFIAPIYPLVSLGTLADSRQRLVDRMLGPTASDELRKQYSPEQQVSAETPPTFLVHANDDGLNAEHSVAFYLALKRANVPVEMHVYASGGHGYGIRQRGLPISSWADRWVDWMRAEGFVQMD